VARELQEELQLDAAVVTLDRDGLAYATSVERGIVACRTRDVCDVTGAGDMVLAVLGLCFAAGLPFIDSLRLANAAAGLEVERFGVEPIMRSELIRGLERDQGISQGAVTLDELLVHVGRHRRAGRSVVFTNGCFDLLHVGHVSLLEEAAQLGDVLVVAINGDASVRRLKGSKRPIIGEHDRARMLAALGCVDHVLVFDDETPHRLLEAIRPDALVKGGTTGQIVGAEIVERYGGLVARTTSIPDLSTTNIVKRLQSSFVFPS
jgi:D-beta-D-heptose 7-phosphate kinase/D-beta-D-heptose 1-phosphate adenosyltransferase